MLKFMFLSLAMGLVSLQVFADAPVDLNAYLKAFRENPKSVMDARLPKRDEHGKVIAVPESIFSAEDMRTGKDVEARDEIRKKFCAVRDHKKVCLKNATQDGILSGMTNNDRPENLVENSSIVWDPIVMEQQGLRHGVIDAQPWSESYWPMYEGLLATRYADPSFPFSDNWLINYNYSIQHGALNIFNSGVQSQVDRLSPSEKYDLLMDDPSLKLTRYSWATGKRYYDAYGAVATWMGICDGWSAASVVFKEPTKSLPVTTLGGHQITLYASDVRGLASLLWAKASPPVMFAGTRCNVTNPQRDANGRIINQACFDNNPATFHVGLVNELGVLHRPLIMDANYDYEVWNFPIMSYSYTYFNPQSMQAVTSLPAAMVPRGAFTNDKFSTYRDPNTKVFVGISMLVTYAVELNPTTNDGPRTKARSVNYVYDLELDGNGKIIGGEWYSNGHPDFLWHPRQGTRASSVADGSINSSQWTGQGAFPPAWRHAAQVASPRGQPLAAAIERLIQLMN